MPGKSKRSKVKSVRLPNDLIYDIEAVCKDRDKSVNAYIVETLRLLTPRAPRPQARGQKRLWD